MNSRLRLCALLFGRATLAAFASSGLGLSIGCASTATVRPAEDLHVTVVSATASFNWHTDKKLGTLIAVNEFDGSSHELVWPAEVVVADSVLKELVSCLSDLRWRVRLANSTSMATARFIGTEVTRCAAASGMPPYQEMPGPFAATYIVELATGNVNDVMPKPQGSRIAASGGPFLGARRLVHDTSVGSNSTASDVKQCAAEASSKGVFSGSTAKMNTQGTLQTTSSFMTFEPMVRRFDECLRRLDYVVSDIAASAAS